MQMHQDDIIHYYTAGLWDELIVFLEEKMNRYLEDGNEIQLARVLCYYGIIHLYKGNYHLVSTIYKQIHDEYSRQPVDVRVKACYARFLAIYHAFAGESEQSAGFYHQALHCYAEMDWYTDEAIAILEYIYWLCLLSPDGSIIFKPLERLKVLNVILHGWLQEELTVLEHCTQSLQNLDNQQLRPGPDIATRFLDLNLFSKSAQLSAAAMMNTRLFLYAVQCLSFTLSVTTEKQPLSQWMNEWNNMKENQAFPKYVVTEMINGLTAVMQLRAQNKSADIQDVVHSYTAKLELYRHTWFSKVMQQVPILGFEKIADPPPTPFRLSITLFQSFTIQWRDICLNGESWGTKQERELFLYVLLQPSGRVSKDVLLEELFPGSDMKKTANRLYVTIHRLNRSFQKSFQLAKNLQVIQLQQGSVVISHDLIDEVDIYSYQKLLSVANQLWTHNRKAAVELMNKARQLYSVDILPDILYLDWLNQFREELKNLQIKMLGRLLQYYYDKAEFAQYEEVSLELMQLEPFDEERYKLYIEYLLQSGRQTEAYRWYRKLERELDRELGIAPSPQLTQIVIPLLQPKEKMKSGGNE